MIKTLTIKNFKSIKQAQLDCKKINVFIGEPNTGKSNILETLGFCSWLGHVETSALKDFIRFERTNNLFHDENLDDGIVIKTEENELNLSFANGHFQGNGARNRDVMIRFGGDYSQLHYEGGLYKYLTPFKYYKFMVLEQFTRPESDYLLPPSGTNLMSLILSHRELRSIVNNLFAKFGFRLNMRPQENKIEVIKHLEDISVSYPYSLTSDTIQRIIFHLCAIQSNKDSILVFEEPESHSFPYYTKYFAEQVALDEKNNQFFISTHNPYMLLPLIEKAPKDEVMIYITYFKDYQTHLKLLKPEEIEDLTEIDIFSNLERFLETR